MTTKQTKFKSFQMVEEEVHKQAQEAAQNQRLDLNFGADQTGGFPFNAQFFYPERDALDTVNENEVNIVDKLTK